MNICFVIDDMNNGGAQRVVSVLANAFCEQGHLVRILSWKGSETPSYPLVPGVQSIFLDREVLPAQNPMRRLTFKIKSRLTPAKSDILEAINRYKDGSDRVAAYFKAHPADVVFSFLVTSNIFVGLAARRIHAKIVVAERNFPDRPMEAYLKELRNRAYAKADVCVFQTKEQAEAFPKAIQKKAIVIPNPVKDGLPAPFVGERRKSIVNYCGFKEHKNIPLLLDAFALIAEKHPDYTLELFGYGDEKPVKEKIATLGLADRVTMRPFLSDIHSEVKDAAMFVMSSDYEGMPNALIEAVAIGLPVISTDCKGGGAKALIRDHENGLLTPVGDAKALAEAMEFYIEQPNKAEEYAKEALSIKRDLSLDKIAERWLALCS